MNDFHEQILWICNSIERMLWQIDSDPLSPTYGCAHLAYWRDKTSELADTRRQEVMLAFALLYKRTYPGSKWQHDERLKTMAAACLSFWCKSQYTDGSFDEWYKGERAFAAAAFSTYAVSRTLDVLGDELDENLLRLAHEKLQRSANWLKSHNDLFKTNHQAVGTGALAWAGHVLQDESCLQAARQKLDSILPAQSDEGWFPEIGYMDVGYSFLTVEFVEIAMQVLGDWRWEKPFIKSYEFACQWVHPDLTTGEEYGSCHNPYISRIATILLSTKCSQAAFLRQQFESRSAEFDGFKSVLADDLRLFRWASQPLIAYDYLQSIPAEQCIEPRPSALLGGSLQAETWPKAGLKRIEVAGHAVIMAACAGGMLRLFGEGENVTTDYGFAIKFDGQSATNQTFNPGIPIIEEQNKTTIECPVSPVKKFMPSFLSRLILRIACSTAVTSRLTRKAIDIIRKKKGTSINQASANLSSSSDWSLKRSFIQNNDFLTLEDTLTFNRPLAREHLYLLQKSNRQPVMPVPVTDVFPDTPKMFDHITFTRECHPGAQWSISPVSHQVKETG